MELRPDTPIWIIAHESHMWLLRGFAYTFNKYASPDCHVNVYCKEAPKFDMPDNFRFYRHGRHYFLREWSNSLIDLTKMIRQEYEQFVLMLEDYWLTAKVDKTLINSLMLFAGMEDNLLRLDLSNDRASKAHRVYGKTAGGTDIVRSPSTAKYLMSFQAGIWNCDKLLEVLLPGESPWDVEILGTRRLALKPQLKVLGTLVRPLTYVPVYRVKQNKFYSEKLPLADISVIQKNGWDKR